MKNRLHLDVVTSDIPEAAEQAQALGAGRVGGIWPRTYVTPKYPNLFGIGIAFAPPHPISRPHTASMAEMGAACVASAGAGFRKGTAASMVPPHAERALDLRKRRWGLFRVVRLWIMW